jgi:tetratricopeptide (TPR) repeat protein
VTRTRVLAIAAAVAVALAGARAARAERAHRDAPAASAPAPAPAPETEPAAAPAPAPAPEAQPANVTEARARMARGEELFAAGNYDAALAEFQQAYDVIGEHPNRYLVLYNIGQCHERSFRYDLALRFYRQYLREGGEGAEGRADVEAAITRLEALLATVRVDVNVPSAEVWVDERPLGTAPGSVRIPPGLHTVEVRAAGHLSSRQEVQIAAGGERSLTFTMERVPERYRGLHRAYFWASAGTAAACLVTGVGLGIAAFRENNDLANRLDDDQERWDVTQAEIDHVGTLALAADIFYASTAVFTITSVILALMTDWHGRGGAAGAPRARAPRLSPLAGTTGVTLTF